MSLELVLLLLGAAMFAGASVPFVSTESVAVRSASAATLVTGALMLTIGLVNALSGTI